MELRRDCERFRTSVERCLLGTVTIGRSKTLVWNTVADNSLDPLFVAVKRAVSSFMWRRRVAHKHATDGRQVAESLAKSARGKVFQYLESWGWIFRGGATFSTPEGDVNLDVDAACTIQRCLVKAWIRDLMSTDNHCSGDDTKELCRSASFPFFKMHEQFGARGGAHMKTAIGAAPDFRNAVGLVKSKTRKQLAFGKALEPPPSTACSCGFGEPGRRHFVWHCPHAVQPPMLRFKPRCGMEEGLLVPLVLQPCAPLPRTLTRERAFQYHIETLLRKARASADGLIRVATDGGSFGHGFDSCGGVGIATASDQGASSQLFGLTQAPGLLSSWQPFMS